MSRGPLTLDFRGRTVFFLSYTQMWLRLNGHVTVSTLTRDIWTISRVVFIKTYMPFFYPSETELSRLTFLTRFEGINGNFLC